MIEFILVTIIFFLIVPVIYVLTFNPLDIFELASNISLVNPIENEISKSNFIFKNNFKNGLFIIGTDDLETKKTYYNFNYTYSHITVDNGFYKKTYDLTNINEVDQIAPFLFYSQ